MVRGNCRSRLAREDIYWECPLCGGQTLQRDAAISDAQYLRVVCAVCSVRGRCVEMEPTLLVYTLTGGQR